MIDRDLALAYLLGGKVTIRKTYMPDDGPQRARIVRAVVTDLIYAEKTFIVTFGPLLGWSCSCGAREHHRVCAHIIAVQMVTGHTAGTENVTAIDQGTARVGDPWSPQPGDLWRDRDGDLWFAVGGDEMVSPETATAEVSRVLRKYGPLTRVHSEPDGEMSATQPVEPTPGGGR